MTAETRRPSSLDRLRMMAVLVFVGDGGSVVAVLLLCLISLSTTSWHTKGPHFSSFGTRCAVSVILRGHFEKWRHGLNKSGHTSRPGKTDSYQNKCTFRIMKSLESGHLKNVRVISSQRSMHQMQNESSSSDLAQVCVIYVYPKKTSSWDKHLSCIEMSCVSVDCCYLPISCRSSCPIIIRRQTVVGHPQVK